MNQQLPTLYSRRSDGSTQEWNVEVEGNKYRSISGMQNGQKVTSEWTVCAGKNIGRANETTPEQQAEAEAKAKWTKKKDAKYSESIDKMDEECVFRPMLAKTFEDYEKDLFKPDGSVKQIIYGQGKLDGICILANKEGLFSRNGKKFVACPHIETALAPIFAKFPETIFHGEGYNHELKEDFNTICSCIKRTKPSTADIAEARQIQYHIYDLPSSAGKYHSRQLEIAALLAHADNTEGFLQPVKTVIVSSRKNMDFQFEQFIAEGYEGMMLRLDKPYENKRSSSLLKVKTFQDAEFEILDIVGGVGNRQGMTGYMCFEREGVPFKANVKGDRAYLKELLGNKDKYFGRLATVKYFNLTPPPREVPRFPCVTNIDRASVEG